MMRRRSQVLRHDKSREGAGYGVVSGHGGNPCVDGNTFAHNRRAVAADIHGQTSCTAKRNLVTESNEYCNAWVFCWKEQDFDVHGTGDGSHSQGGSAGYLFEMRSNTFFSDGKNIDIRGDAIKNATAIGYRVQISGSSFPSSSPQIVIGDFDGDGTQDDFIGTGAAWFYRANRTATMTRTAARTSVPSTRGESRRRHGVARRRGTPRCASSRLPVGPVGPVGLILGGYP